MILPVNSNFLRVLYCQVNKILLFLCKRQCVSANQPDDSGYFWFHEKTADIQGRVGGGFRDKGNSDIVVYHGACRVHVADLTDDIGMENTSKFPQMELTPMRMWEEAESPAIP